MLTEDDWREKIAAKHKEKKQKELSKKAKETSTITRPVEPIKSAKEAIQQQPCNTVPLLASLKTKMEEPASMLSALTNITISIPEQRRSNPKCNGKKNFVFDELVFSSSDLSSESVSEEESVAWYCRKCYKETPPGHLKVHMTTGSNVIFANNGITQFVKMLTLIVTLTESLNAVIANKVV